MHVHHLKIRCAGKRHYLTIYTFGYLFSIFIEGEEMAMTYSLLLYTGHLPEYKPYTCNICSYLTTPPSGQLSRHFWTENWFQIACFTRGNIQIRKENIIPDSSSV